MSTDKAAIWVIELLLTTLAVWWSFAALAPALGMTYWGLLLPVWAVGAVIDRGNVLP